MPSERLMLLVLGNGAEQLIEMLGPRMLELTRWHKWHFAVHGSLKTWHAHARTHHIHTRDLSESQAATMQELLQVSIRRGGLSIPYAQNRMALCKPSRWVAAQHDS